MTPREGGQPSRPDTPRRDELAKRLNRSRKSSSRIRREGGHPVRETSTNPIEPALATVRHRTKVTTGTARGLGSPSLSRTESEAIWSSSRALCCLLAATAG
jgi:hypothetical protein